MPSTGHAQVHQGILDAADAEACIGTEFNPVRAGFHENHVVWTRDVLNVGVRPDWLIERVGISCLLCFCVFLWVMLLCGGA